MKKKLTLFSLLVMAMSLMNLFVFTQPSYADFQLDNVFAKSSSDFSDLSGLTREDKLKYDYLLQNSILSGETDNVFGVDQTFTRAELAQDLVNIFALAVNTTVTSSDFSDVAVDDAVYGSALPAMETVYNGNIMDLADKKSKTFNPGAIVTREELAKDLLKGLKLDDTVKKTDPVKDDSVDSAFASYVALSLKLNMMTNVSDGKFGGQDPATKGTLALAAFAAITQQPNKYFILDAKQTASHQVTITFNQAPPTKAVVNIQQYGVVLSGVPKWSSDGKSVVFTMDDPLQKSTYQAVMTGLDDGTVGIDTLDFTTDEEQVKSIEMVTPSDKLPSALTAIQLKAKNQFGEEMKLDSSDLTVYTDLANKTVSFDPDQQTVTLDLRDALTQGKKQVTVILMYKKTGVTVQKTYTIADLPTIKSIQLGDIAFPANQTYLKPGQTAYIPIKAYDQYGQLITDFNVLNQEVSVTDSYYNALINDSTVSHFVDPDGNGPELQVVANPNVDSDKLDTVTLFGPNGAKAVSNPIRIFATRTPAKVEFYNFSDTLADGDGSSDIQINVFDSSGYQLTPDEIVNAETNGDITIYSTGPVVVGANPPTRYDVTTNVYRPVAIEASGNTGQIRVDHVSGQGPGTVNVRINGLMKTYTLPVNVRAARVPDSMWISNTPPVKTSSYKISPNSKDGPTFQTNDQYDKQFKTDTSDTMVQMTVEKLSGDWGALKNVTGSGYSLTASKPTALISISKANNSNGNKFYANAGNKYGTFKLTARLVKVDSSKNVVQVLDSASATCEIFNPATTDLLYSVDMENNLLDAGKLLQDNGMTNSTVVSSTYFFDPANQALYQVFYQGVGLNVTDVQGNTVRLDGSYAKVLSISSDNQSIVATNGINNVIGFHPGTANVTVTYQTPAGIQQVTQPVTVHDDQIQMSDLKIGRTSFTIDGATIKINGKSVTYNGATVDLNVYHIWEPIMLNQLQAIDNYGDQFTNLVTSSGQPQDQIYPYNGKLIDVHAFITDVQYVPGTNPSNEDTISINPDFTINYQRYKDKIITNPTTNNISQFTINVTWGTKLQQCVITLRKN